MCSVNIGILGMRGIPAEYGGFETFVENLAPRLVQRGHKVSVYNRPGYGVGLKEFHGVRLKTVRAVHNKYLDTISHTFLSLLDATFRERFDILLVCNVGNSLLLVIPRLKGIPTVLNVDGLEWKRKKWPAPAKWYLQVAEQIATLTANMLVTDANVVKQYYQRRYHRETVMIPYGCDASRSQSKDDSKFLQKMGLSTEHYFLYVSRLEPENNADTVLRAFVQTKKLLPNCRLALIGDAPYANTYKRELFELAAGDNRVVMPGGVYGNGYSILQRNALAYIHATEVGGTHPALVEGMAYGNCVLAFDVPENAEVLGDAGLLFRNEIELVNLMVQVGTNRVSIRHWGRKASHVVQERFSWNVVTTQYEDLFDGLVKTEAASSHRDKTFKVLGG